MVALTADPAFADLVRSVFGANAGIDLQVVNGGLAAAEPASLDGADVVIADLDAERESHIRALQDIAARFGGAPPLVVVTNLFNEPLARLLLQIRVADFLVKPASPMDLVRACGRITQAAPQSRAADAKIYSFFPAAGGVGVTTLAIEAAMQLMRSGAERRATTCLVDLDFQHGACADYLDIEPRLDLGEIEPQPERLDWQLLEVMLSRHASGLTVIAAPSRPAEMRSFDPDIVTRLLDLVSANFDYVVIDMPQTWFSWTDSVLLGSDHVFVVTEMTIPGVRHARKLVDAFAERFENGIDSRVIVNRCESAMFSPGLRQADLAQALGPAFAGSIPNNYRLVREAIDRGVPLPDVKSGNSVSAALKKLLAATASDKAGATPAQPAVKKPSLLWFR
jgi:pilus assembly protein CpaE